MITVAPFNSNKHGLWGGEATSSIHPQAESLILQVIKDTAQEWRRRSLSGIRVPLDTNCAIAQNLLTTLDFFMSYG